MASSMAKLAVILSIVSSLFVLSLARIPVDLATEPDTLKEIPLPEESNTTLATISPDESTELEVIDPIKKFEEEEEQEEKDSHVSNLELPGEFTEHQVVAESDPGMTSSDVIWWEPREDEEKKDEETVTKKKTKSTDESDTDSDSDSDDEEEEEEEEDKHKKKRKKNRGKKGGFLRRFLKWINFFD